MTRLMLALTAALFANSAIVQDIFVPPVTTANPGYLFPNSPSDLDRHLTDDNSANEDAAPTQQIACEISMIPDADWAALHEEYALRSEQDGVDSAQMWVDEMSDYWHNRLIEEGVCDE